MGAWGTGLYEDDVACDIKSAFPERLGSGEGVAEATRALADAFGTSLAQPETDPVFWLALADTQWKLGRLLPEVKAAAEAVVAADLERWGEDPALARKRGKVLDKLVEKLGTPQPAPKAIKAVPWVEAPLQAGELVSYEAPDGRRVLLHVLDARGGRGSATVYVRLLASPEDGPLTAEVAAQLPELPCPPRTSSGVIVLTSSERSVPRKRLRATGITLPVPTDHRSYALCTWREVPGYLAQRLGLR